MQGWIGEGDTEAERSGGRLAQCPGWGSGSEAEGKGRLLREFRFQGQQASVTEVREGRGGEGEMMVLQARGWWGPRTCTASLF